MITDGALKLLEFPKLLRIISSFSHSDASRKAVLGILPLSRPEEIRERLAQVEEIRRISAEGSPLRLSEFSDILPLLVKVRPEGSVLETKELSAFTPFLAVLSEISLQLEEREDLPYLKELSLPLTGFPVILALLEKSLDSEGNILDSASPLLSELRARVRRSESRIAKRLEEMTRDERVAVFLQDTFVTQRSGRWVIPVRMDAKGQVPGVVHDVSRSGETAFVEPLAIIGLSNELENLLAEQKAEEMRILRDICARIRAAADELGAQFRIIMHLDLLNSVACFADQLRMQSPQIDDSGVVRLVNARHPLLFLTYRKNERKEDIVPLDVALGGDNTVMVITGSNAGGKTIAIKTIGLLQLMALSGIPVPADSSSRFPLIRELLIDMGDEQSIENSLSTFSAHISNISGILRKAGPDTIVLIDELGTGTDPEEGAALACAVLKELKARGALLFATTHLTDIKGFVHRTAGMINASMEFDEKTLSPLFRLRMGEPGQSHALEIAKRYGLPAGIIESAKGLLGGIRVEFDNLIADLNAKRAEYEKALKELSQERGRIEEKGRLLEERSREAERREKEILAKAYGEASEIIVDTKRRMHAFLDELKKKGREKSREVIREADSVLRETDRKLRECDASDAGVRPLDAVKEGDMVFVRSIGYDASVIEVDKKHNRLRVRSGGIEIEIPASDAGVRKGISVEARENASLEERRDATVSSRITLIGLRVDEALSRLEPFLNHASLAGLQEVTIIHGFGSGILARAVREHLEGHPLVRTFRKGERQEGAAGVTIATLT
ncbi:MAG: endonuclease MutS2 [Nitrospirae bacterium]|nr:endonuclease MutS2 [Nitrospirota bacterium]